MTCPNLTNVKTPHAPSHRSNDARRPTLACERGVLLVQKLPGQPARPPLPPSAGPHLLLRQLLQGLRGDRRRRRSGEREQQQPDPDTGASPVLLGRERPRGHLRQRQEAEARERDVRSVLLRTQQPRDLAHDGEEVSTFYWSQLVSNGHHWSRISYHQKCSSYGPHLYPRFFTGTAAG